MVHPYKAEIYPPLRNKTDAWQAPNNVLRHENRNSRKNSTLSRINVDSQNAGEKIYDTGKVKGTQCTLYRDHSDNFQNSHRCEFLLNTANRAQFDEPGSIDDNRNPGVGKIMSMYGKYII